MLGADTERCETTVEGREKGNEVPRLTRESESGEMAVACGMIESSGRIVPPGVEAARSDWARRAEDEADE